MRVKVLVDDLRDGILPPARAKVAGSKQRQALQRLPSGQSQRHEGGYDLGLSLAADEHLVIPGISASRVVTSDSTREQFV